MADEQVVEEEVIDQEVVEEGDEGDQKSDEEAEFWQNIDKEEADEDASVPVVSHIRLKEKLKGRIKERDSEIEELRRQMAELKSQSDILGVVSAPAQRPDQDEYDSKEEYHAALDKFEEQQHRQRASKESQAEQAVRATEARKAAVDTHYKRADEFVSKYGIAPEKYKKSDESIRKAVDAVLPGQGEVVTDHLISLLGEGSEKVLFRVGARPEVLREFQSLLMEDKTGLKAGIFLGRQLELITNPKKRETKAPPPSRQLKGDAAPNANAAALKKTYQEAHKKGDAQKAYNAKKAARAAGVNVSAW